jgi:acetylglutamate kinase
VIREFHLTHHVSLIHTMQLLKIGGNELDSGMFLAELARIVAGMTESAVIVHGGGKAIADMQARLGIPTVKVDGLRVTDGDSLLVAQMVLSGYTNKVIVAALLAAGVQAVGLSGVDGGLLRCRKKEHPTADLGYVGEIVQVQPESIYALLDKGFTPVISPISLGLDGQVYNVNADEAAGAIAAALKVDVVNFVSNVPGVLDGDGRLIASLTPVQTAALIQKGIIRDGMVPKVQAALDTLARGVTSTRIVNLAALAAGGGTQFSMR